MVELEGSTRRCRSRENKTIDDLNWSSSPAAAASVLYSSVESSVPKMKGRGAACLIAKWLIIGSPFTLRLRGNCQIVLNMP